MPRASTWLVFMALQVWRGGGGRGRLYPQSHQSVILPSPPSPSPSRTGCGLPGCGLYPCAPGQASVRPTPPPRLPSGWSPPTRGAAPLQAGLNSLAVHSLHQPARYLLLFQGPQHAFPPVLPPLQVDHEDLRPTASVGPSGLAPGPHPEGRPGLPRQSPSCLASWWALR